MYFQVLVTVLKGHAHNQLKLKIILTHATRRSITSGFRKYTKGLQWPVAQPAPYAPTLLDEDICKQITINHENVKKLFYFRPSATKIV